MQIDVEREQNEDKSTITVLYFGAGRGPLIKRTIEAARRADVYDRL